MEMVERMSVVEKMDGYGKGAWIVAMILGFILFWPLGLAILFFLIWSGRMGCKGRHNHWRGRWHGMGTHMRSSGNSAFDEYKAETNRRLEDEQKAFTEFLDRLRRSKDKQEFDQFMDELKNGKGGEPQPAA
ncbi:MAG: DUF2852 domain-containing protein [Flavobacteriaceae bacterium]